MSIAAGVSGAATSEGAGTPDALPVLAEVANALDAADRADLAERVRIAAARLARPHTVVCVVGEFKQGKSMLVNALLGRPVCPVDDDLATSAVTVVQYAPRTSVVVVRREHDRRVRDEITPGELPRYVTEVGNPGNELGVEQVAIGLNDPLLAAGFALVDTPGVGGLGAGHAAATLAFLPYADAVVLVSDASAELSAPELEFLTRAVELGPPVVLALTKTDLYPSWRSIESRNRRHLARAGLEIPSIAVSASAAAEGFARDDADLYAASGVPELLGYLRAHALDAARSDARVRAERDALDAISIVRAAIRDEKVMLDDPAASIRRRAELDTAIERLEHLRGPGARWSQRLTDAGTDLTSQVTHRFRATLRELTRATDERIESLDSPQAWDELGRALQAEVADAVADIFAFVEHELGALRTELGELLALEALPPPGSDTALAVESLLGVRLRDLVEQGRLRSVAGGSLGVLRGAQSGLLLFGLLGRFVPAGAAALLFSNPVTLVLGAAFAGKAAIDVRKRAVANRRQQARTAVRQYLDDVGFEVGNELNGLLRTRLRALRDEFATATSEATRTLTDLAERTRADLAADRSSQQTRRQHLERLETTLAGLAATLSRLDHGGSPRENTP